MNWLARGQFAPMRSRMGGFYGRPFSFVVIFLYAPLEPSTRRSEVMCVARYELTYVQLVRVSLQVTGRA